MNNNNNIMDFDTDKVTLQYLANNVFNKKYNENSNENNKIIHHSDLLFYKKRLLHVFKLQLKNNKINKEVDNIFDCYISNLINIFKLEDRNEEIQNALKLNDLTINSINENILEDMSCNINEIMYKKITKQPNIENFVINKIEHEIIYPEIKTINIETEYYKRKYSKKK